MSEETTGKKKDVIEVGDLITRKFKQELWLVTAIGPIYKNCYSVDKLLDAGFKPSKGHRKFIHFSTAVKVDWEYRNRLLEKYESNIRILNKAIEENEASKLKVNEQK